MNRALPSVLTAALCCIVVACNSPVATPTVAPAVNPTPSEPATTTPTSAPTLAPTAAPIVLPTATPEPTASPVAVIPLCNPAHLAARITRWDAGQGHRTATVEVTNAASTMCKIRALDRPQLVDGHGSVIINGPVPAASGFLVMTPGSVLMTLVDDDNYCGQAPVAPVSVAFIYPGGVGRFVATPLSSTNLSGVPPCNGPTLGASIAMHPWAP